MNKELLDIYSDYLISQNHYATATGLSDLLEGSISHDKVTRFLNKNHFGSKELWSYVKKHVRQYEERKRRYLGRYFAHPMMQNRRAKRDDYKPSAVRVTQRYVP
ncbi:hypothetical protein Psal071_00563 [Piscirickettsia salmonis]|uniref:Uncharacterized protein n=1 Tax=Piscirickettsia salmonis TaxID=1238 RepID=A0A9Q6LIT3_PISSA|nr:hypothetical protein [Piscirickettsia salmonis]QGN93995.1 hypothetical protein Psal006a_00566 [Piscirickettsia salmonis]QGO04938.1 hypothetical protein Psal009_00817 [Piscirickettsia salmonis]QGO33259.1 hypothetical protein Psal028_00564 [Piscirickettsia salmonis]QGO36871.1 hypothetical protein Psal040_00564 [Piscirickettsia salmonis]QGO40495.1 hypothetical protein Psal041_00563 [Piscirickettsia salmonis]